MKNYKRFLALTAAAGMILSLAACGSQKPAPSSGEETGANTEPIQIATKPMTEQYILGEMLKQIIEDKTD